MFFGGGEELGHQKDGEKQYKTSLSIFTDQLPYFWNMSSNISALLNNNASKKIFGYNIKI